MNIKKAVYIINKYCGDHIETGSCSKCILNDNCSCTIGVGFPSDWKLNNEIKQKHNSSDS